MNIPKYFISLLLLVFVVLSSELIAQEKILFSPMADVEASVKTVPCDQKLRLEGVRQLFKSAGATDEEILIEKFDKDKTSNLVVRKKGETDETIIVGAHYDRTDSGCGAVDNWTGVSIISHIYKSLRPLNTKKSYVFVAFDREEVGLIGSKQMVKTMPKEQIEKTCSMINFDSFGQALPMALRNASSPKLVKLAENLGTENKFKFQAVTIEGASSDSASFQDKKIPAITLSGLGGDWMKVLHTSSDKIDKVNMESVYLGYRFGLIYLAKLEAAGCGDYK
ncbi:hypothetical protein BH24ACI3_BH24ACI3_14360 [soil metagenome]